MNNSTCKPCSPEREVLLSMRDRFSSSGDFKAIKLTISSSRTPLYCLKGTVRKVSPFEGLGSGWGREKIILILNSMTLIGEVSGERWGNMIFITETN
jgi:hypothetical protein